MPTLLKEDGFRFFFYSNEHDPAHVHIEKGDTYAKIELDTFKVVEIDKAKGKDKKKMLDIVKANNKNFKKSWKEHLDENKKK